ncbi:MAG: hypothetical protein ACFCVG_02060 [Kineosporiaceae bacterium]
MERYDVQRSRVGRPTATRSRTAFVLSRGADQVDERLAGVRTGYAGGLHRRRRLPGLETGARQTAVM